MAKYAMTPEGRKQIEMSLEEKLDKLIHIYELECQSIVGRMPEFERRGAGHYYKHRLSCYTQFVSELKSVRGGKEHGKIKGNH